MSNFQIKELLYMLLVSALLTQDSNSGWFNLSLQSPLLFSISLGAMLSVLMSRE